MNAMRYNFVIYEEEMLFKFIMALGNAKGKNISNFKYAYILHDSDIVIETGEIKKPHYHLWLEFNDAVKSNFIDNILSLVGGSSSMRSNQKTDRNFLAYLTHDTSKSGMKKHYEFKDIVTNIDDEEFKEMYYDAIAKTNKPSKAKQEVDTISRLFEIVSMNNDIISLSSLMNYIINSGDDELMDLMPYIMKRSYGLNMALKDVFMNNATILSSMELEKNMPGMIEANKKKYRKLKSMRESLTAQSQLLDKMIEKEECKK